MNSWSGDWGKQGYAWIPSEMLDWAEVGFAVRAQKDLYSKLVSSGEVQASNLIFREKKYRMSWEN